MSRFEDALRGWLDRRWRRRASQQEITDAETRAALDEERLQIAALQSEVITRLAFLSRAERSDGWERAQLVGTHTPHL